MKKIMRKMLLSTLAVMATATAMTATAFSFSTKTASGAEAKTVNGEFSMAYGASIRMAMPLGLRFIAQMDQTVYNDLITKEDGVEQKMGMFIMPYEYLNDASKYSNGAIGLANQQYENITTKINHIFYDSTNSSVDMIYQGEGEYDGYYCANGVVTNLQLNNYDRDFIGIAYIATTDSNGTTYEYADFNVKDNVRSAAYVASEAYGDYGDPIAQAVFEQYVYGAHLADLGMTQDGETYTYNNKTYPSVLSAMENLDMSISVSFANSAGYIKEGYGSTTLTPIYKDNWGNEVDVNGMHAILTSNDDTMVTIDKGGKVTALVDSGNVTIEAAFMGSKATCDMLISKIDFENGNKTSYFSGSRVQAFNIVEANGTKALQAKTTADSVSDVGIHVKNVLLDMIFSDSTVDYMAFDIKLDTTATTLMPQIYFQDYRSGKSAWKNYESTACSNDFNYIPTETFKTLYFPREVYESWLANGQSNLRFLLIGQGVFGGQSFYIDNIRGVSAEEKLQDWWSFEYGGLRTNNGNTPLFYTPDNSQWELGFGNVDPTTIQFSHEQVTHGNRSLKFTKKAGETSISLNHSTDTEGEKMLRKAGYMSFDLYVPEGSDAALYNNSSKIFETLNKGWNTIYAKVDPTGSTTGGDVSNVITKFWDSTASTYYIDNIRVLTEEEFNYNADMLGFEGKSVIMRNETETAEKSVAYLYAKRDALAGKWTFVASATDTTTRMSNFHYDTEIVKEGKQSLAFHKTNGYVYFALNTSGEMYELLKNGFSFWMYADLDEQPLINVQGTSNFVSGTNAKFAGLTQNIQKGTWTKITVQANEINSTGRFLIIQGSTAGTYYFDRFIPLESYEVTYDAGVGTVTNETQTIEYGDEYTLETPIYNKYLYEFAGWYNGDKLVPMSGDSWNIREDVTLTAKYNEVDISGNFYKSEGELDQNGVLNNLTLDAGTHNAGLAVLPTATEASHISDMSYYRFGGEYGVNDTLVFEVTGDNMPIISFFSTNVINTIYNHSKSVDQKGWLFFNGMWLPNGLPDGGYEGVNPSRLNVIGPYQITYRADNSSNESPKSTRASDGSNAVSPSPVSLRMLHGSTDEYRVIIGWQESGSNMILRLLIWDLTTGEKMIEKAITTQTKADWKGDIVLYGHFGKETVINKVYPIVNGWSEAVDEYKPAMTSYKTTWDNGEATLAKSTVTGAVNRPAVDSTDMSYIAFNGNYGYGDYLVFDFTGGNMPIVSFFNSEVTNTVYNNATTTSDNAGVKDPNASGIVICGGLYNQDGTIWSEGYVNSCRLIVVGNTKVLGWDDNSNGNAGTGGGRYSDGSATAANPLSATALQNVTDTYRVIIGFSAAKKLNVYVMNMTTGTKVWEKTMDVCAPILSEGSIALHGNFGKETVLNQVFGVEENTTVSALVAKYAKDTDYSDEAAVTLDRYAYSAITNGTFQKDGESYCSTCGTQISDSHKVCKDFREDQATYDTYAAAGFNVMLPQSAFDLSVATWSTQGVRYMNMAHEAGLKVILTDYQLQCLSEPLVVKDENGTKSIAIYTEDFKPWIIKGDTSERATAYRSLVEGLGFTLVEYSRSELDIKVRNELAQYKDHPAFYGVMLGDEPTYHNAYCYGELYKSIKRVMPTCYVQYNLNPLQDSNSDIIKFYYSGEKYSSPTAAQSEAAYKSYVRAFIDSMGIDYIQYDDYPFKSAEEGILFWKDTVPYVDQTALRNLQIVAEIAKEKGIAVKVVTQSCLMHTGGSSGPVHIRQITENDARWLNNYLMGFGVTQINYFTYWTKASNSSNGEWYDDGGSFVNKNGTTTAVYNFMKTIMADNTAFAPTISHFSYNESQVMGNNTNGNLNNDHINWGGELKVAKNFKWLSSVTESKGNGYVLVTELYDADKYNYMYMFMNTVDPYYGGQQSVTVTLASNVTKFYVYDQSGNRTLVEGNTYTATLNAGQAFYIMPCAFAN